MNEDAKKIAFTRPRIIRSIQHYLDSKNYGGKQKGNLGVGTDLAFVWLNSDRISTFSVGAGLRDKIEDGNGNTVKKVEPLFQISYTLSFGL